MSDHLPECLAADTDAIGGSYWCICDRLRACEQRVRDAEYALPKGHPSRDLSYWEAGFAAGVQAARDAVAALRISGGFTTPEGRFEEVLKDDALAAIDALRGEA